MRFIRRFLARQAQARRTAATTWAGRVISAQPIEDRLVIDGINRRLRQIDRDTCAHNALLVAEATWAA